MKRFGKFIFGTISLAALAGGVFYYLKTMADKRAAEDFEEFEDDFGDDFDDDFEDDLNNFQEKDNQDVDSREYVTINLSSEPSVDIPEEDSDITDTSETDTDH